MTDNQRTQYIFGELLNPNDAIGAFEDCIEHLSGMFGEFLYCTANGRQILLGHTTLAPLPEHGQTWAVTLVQSVFVTSPAGREFHRHAFTWEELRQFIADGWFMGTFKSPGVKICFTDNGHNFRRSPDGIYVLPMSAGFSETAHTIA